MHIVFITGNYYPNPSAPSACIKPYLTDLSKDNDVEVICPLSDPSCRGTSVIEGVKVHFVTSRFNSFQVSAAGKCRRLLVRTINYLQEKVAPTPYNPDLVDAFLEELEKISSGEKIDAMISVTFPFFTHVVALRYKQRHPDVRWLSYTTDPLAFNEANPVPAWKKNKARQIEQAVYDHSDYCLITEELSSNLLEDYHVPKHKLLILPYLMQVEEASEEAGLPVRDRAQVVYAGYFFHKVRNPRVLLGVFSRLEDMDLQLYATGDRICRKMLKSSVAPNITVHGLVPRSEYFKLLNRTDVLVNLSNKARFQAPHKLMELISTGKPIINFFYYQDAGYRIVEKYPLGINISNDTEMMEMADAITSFVSENRQRRLSGPEIEALYPENLLAVQMKKVRAALNI